jgi:hypothetical protein
MDLFVGMSIGDSILLFASEDNRQCASFRIQAAGSQVQNPAKCVPS